MSYMACPTRGTPEAKDLLYHSFAVRNSSLESEVSSNVGRQSPQISP